MPMEAWRGSDHVDLRMQLKEGDLNRHFGHVQDMQWAYVKMVVVEVKRTAEL
jgi:hypothetical protein